MSFYRRYGGFGRPVIDPTIRANQREAAVDPFPVGPGPVVPAFPPIFPPPPIEVQTFIPRQVDRGILPGLFTGQTAQSFMPPDRPVVDVPPAYGPVDVIPSPPKSGQIMTFPTPPQGSSSGPGWVSPDDAAASDAGGGSTGETVAWTPDGLVSVPATKSPLLAAGAGAVAGFALGGGPLGAAIGGAIGYLFGRK